MKVLVCGGREYTDRVALFAFLDEAVPNATEVISGKAPRGADKLAAEWARKRGIPLREFPADWDTYQKAAGPIRNQQMLDEGKPDVVIAFPGGNGTRDMVKKAMSAKLPVLLYSIDSLPLSVFVSTDVGN